MIVIGIDPAKYGFHAALVYIDDDGAEDLQLVAVNVEQKGFQLPSAILAKTHAKAVEMMFAQQGRYPGERIAVFCEEAISAGARNLRTYGQLAMSVGAILAATTLYTPQCYLVPVAKWKQATVGSGAASKDQVALWLNQVHPNYAAECGPSQDLIDACCLARYGIGVLADSALVSAGDSLGPL